MSDEGEKTCPLCAEEMDLTDQQLKPCRCGYEICVWCWHHIMDMAEKDETDGRCPACRTPYDKEKIVGTAANCKRLVAEINMEKKHKCQKAKSKTTENRKQLNSVRVIQKNLVYIVGLPLNLADEDILQRKEYFSQYGKVLKVSISRTSAGTIQQFPNNTCSVYITYGKEEEAVRCIQSVHGFILDGRSLRACFGTTKYCHAWLRYMPCSNPDCLYLHEIGSQEDTFTKDEIISAYTRVEQITGHTNNMQRRTGNVLPPPADDYCNCNAPVVSKPVVKSSSNQNSTSCARGCPPTSSSGRSGALPPAASWGARAPNANNPPAGALACSNGPTKQKSEIVSESQPLSTTVSIISQDKLSSTDGGKKFMTNEETHSRQTTKSKDMSDTSKHHIGQNTRTIATLVPPTSSGVSAVKSATQPPNLSVASNNGGDAHVLHNSTVSVDGQPCSPGADKSASSIADEENKNLSSDLSLMSIENQVKDEDAGAMGPNGLCLDNFLSAGNHRLHLHDSEEFQEHSTLVTDTSAVSAVDSVLSSSDVCDWKSDAQALVTQNPTSETEDDFDSRRLRDAIVVSHAIIPPSSPLHCFSHLRGPSLQHVDNASEVDYASNPPLVNRVPDEGLSSVVSGASDGFLDNFVNHASGNDNPLSLFNVSQVNQVRRYKDAMPVVDAVPGTDLGESSIISNILDLDSWDESLTSQNLAKLLGEADKQEGSINLGGPWKGQNSNQSRFSFARQEESSNHPYNFEMPFSNIGQLANNHSVGQGFVENRDFYMGRLGNNSFGLSQGSIEQLNMLRSGNSNSFGLSQGSVEQSDMLTSGNSIFPSTSRSQISAPRPPPGFAAPSRPPPPPGFNLHERNDQTFEMKSGNHLPEASALLRNTYQSSPVGNISTNSNDIEFLDPAILAVGKGRLPSSVNNSSIDMRSNYHVQNASFENESRLILMQRSISPHQNLRYNDVRDNFLPVNDAYGFNTARHLEQSQVSNLPPFSQFSLQQARSTVISNGHWDNWNEIPATNNSITDLLRNDRLGCNKFGMTSSGDIYNRGFRM